jgi:hypothetical protein
VNNGSAWYIMERSFLRETYPHLGGQKEMSDTAMGQRQTQRGVHSTTLLFQHALWILQDQQHHLRQSTNVNPHLPCLIHAVDDGKAPTAGDAPPPTNWHWKCKELSTLLFEILACIFQGNPFQGGSCKGRSSIKKKKSGVQLSWSGCLLGWFTAKNPCKSRNILRM